MNGDGKHIPCQIGTHDGEGWRTHTTPGDVCLTCSNPCAGRWVPVSQCPQALAVYELQRAELAQREWKGD